MSDVVIAAGLLLLAGAAAVQAGPGPADSGTLDLNDDLSAPELRRIDLDNPDISHSVF